MHICIVNVQKHLKDLTYCLPYMIRQYLESTVLFQRPHLNELQITTELIMHPKKFDNQDKVFHITEAHKVGDFTAPC